MFLSYSLSIWLLFVSLLDFLFQLFVCFFVSCFRWNHCFLTLFICLYSVVCVVHSYHFLLFQSLVVDFKHSVFLYIHVIIFLCFSPFHRVFFVLQRCLMSFFLVAFHISYYLFPVISLFFLSPSFLLLFFSALYSLLLLFLIFLYLYVVIELSFKLLI